MKVALPMKLDEEIKFNIPNIHLALKNAFVKCNEEVARNVPDASFSGSTCCTLLLNGTRIYSANAGDSRAIVVGKGGRVKQLSRDHKPCDKDEG